jgi:hypothetical protein
VNISPNERSLPGPRLELCVGCIQRLKEWLRPDPKERKACECGGVR